MAEIQHSSPSTSLEHNCFDSTIRETIAALHTDFCSAIGGDTTNLIEFMSALAKFNDTVDSSKDKLCMETLEKVSAFAEIVETVTSSILELSTDVDASATEFTTDIAKLLKGVNELSLADSLPDQITESSSLMPYIQTAYDWLLKNLHNPYPSKEVRLQIWTSHNTSRKLVDGWFIDVRKRIGWNSLCKAHFRSSRKAMIDAATAFFSDGPIPSTSAQPHTLAPSGADLAGIFVALENRAKDLYMVKPLGSLDLDCEMFSRGRKRSERCDDGRTAKRQRHVSRAAYPSPPASTHGSPEPVSLSREMSQEREDYVGLSTCFEPSAYHPPSPALTVNSLSPSIAVTPTVASYPSQALFSKRKRSSSAEREAPISKRARRTFSAPVTHSFDFASTAAFDSWPSPVSVESFDFSVDTPPAVEAIPLIENAQWDTNDFEQLIAALQREDTPDLSEAGSSPYSVSSPGLSESPAPEFLPNLDFTTYQDPTNHSSLSVEPEPLMFYNNFNNTPDASTDLFSTLLQPSGHYDLSLAPLDIMPNSWLSPLDQDNLNAWVLQPTDKELSSFGSHTNFCQPTTPTHDDRTAKLLRAQQLREELRKLEQDIQA